MHASPSARAEAAPTGVIDTLTAGYAAINRRPWVLLLPIGVDLFLWLGPQISISPMIQPLLAGLAGWVRRATLRGAASPDLQQEYDTFRQSLMPLTDSTNALTLLGHGPLGLPGVATLLGGGGSFSFVSGWVDGLLLLAGTFAAGMLLGGFFRGLIAQQVRDGRAEPIQVGRRVPRDVLRVVSLLLVLLGALALLGLPILLLVAAAAVIAPPVAVMGFAAAVVAALFVEVHLFFAVDAIFVSGVGPLAAIQRSVAVVRRWLGSTLSLILLSWLILLGMDRVWELLASQLVEPYGVLLSVLGNAYIASGLVAASMIFYKERVDLGLAGSAARVTG